MDYKSWLNPRLRIETWGTQVLQEPRGDDGLALIVLLLEALRHSGEKFGANGGARPGAFGDADAARGGLGKEGDALVEVDIPAFDAADHLFFRADGAGRAGVGADLAGGTKLVGTEAVGCCGDQGHIGGDAGEPHARSEMTADERTMLAKFT